MAKLTKEAIVEKLKEMPQEDRSLFRDALSEIEPDSSLSSDELLAVREMLRAGKETKPPKKNKGFLDWLGE